MEPLKYIYDFPLAGNDPRQEVLYSSMPSFSKVVHFTIVLNFHKTAEEIAELLGVSSDIIHQALCVLEEYGYLKKKSRMRDTALYYINIQTYPDCPTDKEWELPWVNWLTLDVVIAEKFFRYNRLGGVCEGDTLYNTKGEGLTFQNDTWYSFNLERHLERRKEEKRKGK
jgi:hypothetical protein